MNLEEYDDGELLNLRDSVMSDLKAAAENNPESEWHQECFAAAVMVANEIKSRPHLLQKVH